MNKKESAYKKKFFIGLMYFLFCACLLPNCYFAYKHPGHGWDMLGYMAIVIKKDGGKNSDEIHRKVYEAARENIPMKDYDNLVNGLPNRVKFAADPSYFEKVLPIYVVKPLYVWAVYLFYKSGFNLPAATVLPSIISYFLIGLLLFHWLRRYLKNGIAFFSALLIMYSSFAIEMARISTPDCFSAFFLLLAFYFILEKANLWLMFLFSLLSLFTRVDNLITIFFIISFLAFSSVWKERISRKRYFILVAILAISYVVIILPIRQFGWNLFYYSEYIKYMDFSRDFNQVYAFADYFSFAFSKIITGLISSHFIFFMFLAGLIFYPAPKINRRFSSGQQFILLLGAVALIRFILLPDLSDRFYFAFYLIIIIILVKKITEMVLNSITRTSG